MGSPAEQFLPLSVVASITGIWPQPLHEPGVVSILKEYPKGAVGIGLNATRSTLIESTSVSGSCAVPDGHYQGEQSGLTRALSPVFTNRQVNVRAGKSDDAALLPPEATNTFSHASNLDLIEDDSPDATAWKQTLNFQSGPNIDIVEKSKFRNLESVNAILFAIYPAYTYLNSLDRDGYYSLFRHEGRITILRYHNFNNRTHGGTNFIAIPNGRDEYNERSIGRVHQTRALAHNSNGEPGFFTDPRFYDEPSRLLIDSQDPSIRLKWLAQELRTQTRKPSHHVDFGSHHLETLRYSTDKINPNDASRITAEVFNALFENYDFTAGQLKSLGLWGTVFAQNNAREVKQSLERAEATYFRDNASHGGVFSKLSSHLFAELMAIALPIPLSQFITRPTKSDRVIATSYIGHHSPRSLWADRQLTMAKNALEKTKRIAKSRGDENTVKMLEHDIHYFSNEISKSSWD
ncbi:hypothetical protein KBD69_03565 [Candidatus Woesebacteria bacterium]|nr:hypothetical protein [Candidatus Woesebacteria bacterium]